MRLRKWDVLLDSLSATQSVQVQEKMRSVIYEPRAILFRQGAPSDCMVLVHSGRVRLYLLSEEGEEFVTGVTGVGSVLGLGPAVLGANCFQTAEAIDRVEGSRLSTSHLNELMTAIPTFSRNVARLLAILSGESIMRSGPLALDPANMRIASILINLAALDETDPTGRSHVIEGLTQDELAKMVGASRTWVALTLADFERHKLLERKKRWIRIPDFDRLLRYLSTARKGKQ
jgi:CRP/FNR family cyclic AMP-dependent transcriptional regulator